MSTKEAPRDAALLQKRTEERAYALWEDEGRPHGRHLDHWCQAETEIGTLFLRMLDTGSDPESAGAIRGT